MIKSYKNLNNLLSLSWQLTMKCNYHCSYCATCLARGNSRSDTIESIVEEVKKIKNNMLNMLSASYGLDESQACELINNNDSVSYTIALNNIVSGKNDSLAMTDIN